MRFAGARLEPDFPGSLAAGRHHASPLGADAGNVTLLAQISGDIV
jgi:hypothetical protein